MATQAPNDRRVIRRPFDRAPQDGQHRSPNRAAVRRRAGRVVALVASVAIAVTAMTSLPAAADPDNGGASSTQSEPTTADQAKQAWLDAMDKAEIANEDLLAAQEQEKQAKDAVAAAMLAVAQAGLRASTAESNAVQAAAQYANLRSQLSQFASASFRGARLGQLSALLTAESTSDFLDEVASMDQVAGHNRDLMAKALGAKKDAEAAADAAAEARSDAEQSKRKADTALAAATQATKTVAERKKSLDTQVATYRKLFDSLTTQERDDAIQAQQDAWFEQDRQRQQDQAAALTSREEQESARAAAGAPGAASAAPQLQRADSGTAPSGTLTQAARPKAQVAVNAALTRLGYPYVFGAAGPRAFDCSGLTSWAWAQAGVAIPRTSAAQATLPSVPLDQLQPGDLVTYYSPVHHVALYIGNGQVIDAATESKPIFITSVYRAGPYPTGHRVSY